MHVHAIEKNNNILVLKIKKNAVSATEICLLRNSFKFLGSNILFYGMVECFFLRIVLLVYTERNNRSK